MKRLTLFLTLAMFLMVSIASASEDCDVLFKQALDYHKVMHKKIEKTWPVFDTDNETLSLMEKGFKIMKDYRENCLDHYAYPDTRFIEKSNILRFVLGYDDGGKKIKMSTAPGLPFAFFLRERHPEAIVAYVRPSSVKVKDNRIEVDSFKDSPDIVKQPSYCIVKDYSFEKIIIACGETIEKTFPVSVPTVTVNGQPVGDEKIIESSGGQKFMIKPFKYYLGFQHISYDIINWLEKEMLPRGYLNSIQTSTLE